MASKHSMKSTHFEHNAGNEPQVDDGFSGLLKIFGRPNTFDHANNRGRCMKLARIMANKSFVFALNQSPYTTGAP